MLAAELLAGAIDAGEQSAEERCLRVVVAMYLKGGLSPATIARAGAELAESRGGNWDSRDDIDSATYVALEAVYRLHLNRARGREPSKKAIAQLREAAVKTEMRENEPIRPLGNRGVRNGESRQAREYRNLIAWAKNHALGSDPAALRLFVSRAIDGVRGNASDLNEIDRVTLALDEWRQREKRQMRLRAESLVNKTLRLLGKEPPKSGAAKPE